ncbi:MAG: hypothetical protein AB7O67_15700 [Vicinamibacterales bacterium]
MRRKWFVLAPLFFLAFIAVGGLVVQWLWNWLLPSLVGVRAVTFWEALGLLALSRILFGGVGFRGPRGRRGRRMTPEQRQRFRHAMRERFGHGDWCPPPHAAGREHRESGSQD